MIVKSPPKLYTAAQFERLGNTDGKELIRGRLVRKGTDPFGRVGANLSWLRGEVFFRLKAFAEPRRLGFVFGGDCGFRLLTLDPKRLRKPDVSFVKLSRFPNGAIPEGNLDFPPDIAAEVVSDRESCDKLNSRIDEYQDAGVPMIWIVDSVRRRVQVRRADGSIRELKNDDILTGEDVLPGFEIPVRDLFATAPV